MSADVSADPSVPGVPGELKDCQRQLLEARQQLAHVERILAETAVLCEEQQTQIERLRAEMELFRRYLFGRKSERFIEPPGQGHLFDPEDGEGAAALPADDQYGPERTPRRQRRLLPYRAYYL